MPSINNFLKGFSAGLPGMKDYRHAARLYLDDNFKNNSNNRVKQLLGLNYEYPKIMDVSKKANNIGIGYRGKSN